MEYLSFYVLDDEKLGMFTKRLEMAIKYFCLATIIVNLQKPEN
jgi:hypothetical protein